jgi:hypothetical protein
MKATTLWVPMKGTLTGDLIGFMKNLINGADLLDRG